MGVSRILEIIPAVIASLLRSAVEAVQEILELRLGLACGAVHEVMDLRPAFESGMRTGGVIIEVLWIQILGGNERRIPRSGILGRR